MLVKAMQWLLKKQQLKKAAVLLLKVAVPLLKKAAALLLKAAVPLLKKAAALLLNKLQPEIRQAGGIPFAAGRFSPSRNS